MNIGSLLQGLASLAWLLAIGALGFAVFNAARGRRFAGGAALLVGAVIVAVVLTTAAAGLVFIEPEQRGVVVDRQDPQGVRPPRACRAGHPRASPATSSSRPSG